MNNRAKKTNNKRAFALMLAVILAVGIISPVFAREYYNYESRYTITISDDSYEKMSKVNENLMSIIYDDGVSMTFNVSDYYGHLSDEDKLPETTSSDYTVGNEMFAATYNDATYMKDEYFTKRLANVNGTTEMVGATLTEVNGFSFWEMTYNYLDEPTEEMLQAIEDAEKAAEEEDTDAPEGDVPTDDQAFELPVIREDGLTVVGEGKMYFTVYEGYEYRIHMMNKQGKLSDYPDMADIFGTIELGLRQSNIMKIMWITIGVLCFICFVLIIFVLTRKSPKKLAKLRKAAGLDENGKALPQTLAIEGAVEFDEEEQLKNNEMVNAKLEIIAKGNSEEISPGTEEEEVDMIITEYIPEISDEEINDFLDEQLEDVKTAELEIDE